MRTTLKSELAVGAVTLVLFILHPPSLVGDPQEDDDFGRELQTAKTATEVDHLVNKTSKRLGRAIAKLERLLIEDIRRSGPGSRFVIREIIPDEKRQKGSLTLRENPQGGVIGVTENSGDVIPIDLGDLGFTGILLGSSSGSTWIPEVFSKHGSGMRLSQNL
jgi:hypothetical protein